MRIPTPAEAGQLLAAIDPHDPFGPRDHALIRLALHTGLRVSELAGLDARHVTHQGAPRATLFVPRALGKGSRERSIPLNADARQAIHDLLSFNARRGFSTAPGAPLLVTRNHQRVSVRLIQRLVATLRERAGLDTPVTPHGFRHLFATRILQATSNMRVAQQLLGHAQLDVTMRYCHPSRADLEQAVAAIATVGGAA